MPLTEDDRAAMEGLIHVMRSCKSASVTTSQAGKMMGCKEDKTLQLVRAGLLSSYQLPSSKVRQKQLKALNAAPDSDAEPSRDPRHHRIPTICVLLTIAREWIGGFMQRGFHPTAEEAARVIGPLLVHLTLPMLRKVHALVGQFITQREEQLAALGVKKVKSTNARSNSNGNEDDSTGELFATTTTTITH